MDQMLALPVSEDPAEPTPQPVRPPIAATLTLIQDMPTLSAPLHTEIPIKRLGSPPPQAFVPPDLEEEFDDDVIAVTAESLLPVEKPKTPPRLIAPVKRPLPPSPTSWWFRSAVIWERGFRRLSRRFGPTGWLMRTIVGRTALGLAGLALVIAAAAWLAKDWTQWPR